MKIELILFEGTLLILKNGEVVAREEWSSDFMPLEVEREIGKAFGKQTEEE